MKKLGFVLAIMAICGQSFALDIQSEIAVAVANQKKAADSAKWNGFTGLGLTVLGYVVYAVGVSDLASASSAKTRAEYDSKTQSAGLVVALGGGLLLGGSVTSFLGWLDQLNANTYQSEVNAKLLELAAEK